MKNSTQTNEKAIDIDKIKGHNKYLDMKLIETATKLSDQTRKFGHNPDSKFSLSLPLSRNSVFDIP